MTDHHSNIQVKKVTGVDESMSSIRSKLEKTTKDTFAKDLLNDKVVTFLTKDAGSTMYPKLMREIKSKAGKLGVSVPDRFTAISPHPFAKHAVASLRRPSAPDFTCASADAQVRVRGQSQRQAARGPRCQDRCEGCRRRTRRGRRRIRLGRA